MGAGASPAPRRPGRAERRLAPRAAAWHAGRVSLPDDSFLHAPLTAFLDALATEDPLPGSGTAAALAAAMAAGLTAMAARRSAGEVPDAQEAVSEAEDLGERLRLLAVANADAFREASTSLGRIGDTQGAGRDERLGSDLARAAYTPLSIATLAAQVADLAAQVASGGVPDARADAAAACCLAEGATRAAAHLVEINLAVTPADERAARVGDLAEAAGRARERAVAKAG